MQREVGVHIKQHDRSHTVMLADGSEWRIWLGDTTYTLGWLPATEIDIVKVEHNVCSHALVNRADGSRVRVISADMQWPVKTVRRTLAASR
jgi:hypothetical protein